MSSFCEAALRVFGFWSVKWVSQMPGTGDTVEKAVWCSLNGFLKRCPGTSGKCIVLEESGYLAYRAISRSEDKEVFPEPTLHPDHYKDRFS